MYLGIDIGGTKCAVCVGDEKGNVTEKIRFATTSVDETVENIKLNAEKLNEKYHPVSAGVSCGGPLDENKGIIMSPPNLPGWDNIEIKKILENSLKIPVGVRNDANACAIAEFYFGAGRGCKNMVFMTFGTGLGAGLVLNGKLYSGTNGFAGELGHIRLDDYGPSGYGKCGSFEGFCSGSGLYELGRGIAREAIQRGEKVLWAENGIDSVDVSVIAEYARKGDALAKKVFDICGQKLGQGLSIVVDLLNPEKIIIGSVFARCEDLLREAMEQVLNREALKDAVKVCKVCAPELSENIGDAAALAVAMEVKNEAY